MRISDWSSDVCSSDLLDGVVLIDLQVALGHDVQRKAAVLSELVEHVIEERQAGGHLWRGRHVQVELHAHAGLARGAQYQCPPWCIDQGVRNSRPVPLAADLRRSQLAPSSEDRRAGKASVSTCRSRRSPLPKKKKQKTQQS